MHVLHIISVDHLVNHTITIKQCVRFSCYLSTKKLSKNKLDHTHN